MYCLVTGAKNDYIYRWCQRGRGGTRAHALLAPGGSVSAASQLMDHSKQQPCKPKHDERECVCDRRGGGEDGKRERERENNN